MCSADHPSEFARDGQRLLLSGPALELVELLKFPLCEAVSVPEHPGYAVRRDRKTLLEPVCPQLGLADVVRRLLLETLGVANTTSVTSPLQSPIALRHRRRPDQQVIDFIARNAGGLIVCGAGVSRCLIAAAVVEAFPEASITFVCDKQDERFARKLSRITRRHIPFFCGETTSDDDDHPATITTYGGLCRIYPEHEKRHLVVPLDARSSLGDRAQFALGNCRDARLFGFCAVDDQWSPREHHILARTYGFRHLVVPHHAHRLRRVETRWVEHRSATRADALGRDSQFQRLMQRFVSGDRYRSRRIATFAREAAAGRLSGNATADTTAAELLRTIVVAADLQHAADLAARLSGWPILGSQELINAPPPFLRNACSRLAADASTAGCGIVTTMGFDAVDLNKVDVLVWAAAGGHGPALSIDRLAQPLARTEPLTLVDVADDGHPALRRMSRRRADLYRRRGWFAPGVDAHVERVKEYVAGLRRQARHG